MDFSVEDSLEPQVIFEDPSFLAVYKPPRMHSSPGLGAGDLCAWVFELYPEAAEFGGLARRSRAEGGLLHRLDYETSGLVLFARDPAAFEILLGQQESGAFRKEYLALCSASTAEFPEGSLPRRGLPGGVGAQAWAAARAKGKLLGLAALLGAASASQAEPPRLSSSFRPFGPRGSRVACLNPGEERGGRVLPVYSSDILAASPRPLSREGLEAALALELRVGICRGFRHQIRAQLAWIGLPIYGDVLYGGESDHRLRLYAVSLAFEHPFTGKNLVFSIGSG
jgi:23S rRNA pseudouridine1911/1915/1917 synthase